MPDLSLREIIRAAVQRGRSVPDQSRAVDEFVDAAPEDRVIVSRALPYTMTGEARLHSLVQATRYCVDRELPGDFVECGVWRGGSILSILLALQELNRSDREVWLYDTFEGMTMPTEVDISSSEGSALAAWEGASRRGETVWPETFGAESFSEAGVRETLLATGYPPENLRFVRGPVEQTIPKDHPDEIALLRLDTDWYESTRMELEHLYPRLVDGGVLIIDDYGHWRGARQAVDEYFAHRDTPLFNRIDYSARIAIKH